MSFMQLEADYENSSQLTKILTEAHRQQPTGRFIFFDAYGT